MSRIVKSDFFCIKTKVSYKAGDIYDGKRTDLEHVLKPKKSPKPKSTKK